MYIFFFFKDVLMVLQESQVNRWTQWHCTGLPLTWLSCGEKQLIFNQSYLTTSMFLKYIF